jgi:glyoxylase-like metal-dependent hydrolase (beta-lactamase superfamily II)
VKWKELMGEYDIFNDGRLILFPTPGHTPGSQSLFVGLDNEPLILVGDAAYSLDRMRKRILPAVVWNADAMMESWDRIEEMERRHNAQVLVTHDVELLDRVKVGPGAWYS